MSGEIAERSSEFVGIVGADPLQILNTPSNYATPIVLTNLASASADVIEISARNYTGTIQLGHSQRIMIIAEEWASIKLVQGAKAKSVKFLLAYGQPMRK